MADGYTSKGQPDLSWWTEQLAAGLAFRKRWAREEKWPAWRAYARGEWAATVLPVNIFFMMMRTFVPRVYFKDPSVSITPALPGMENMAFAQTLQRVDNKMIRQMGVKRELKRAVRDAFMFGTGIPKLGFGAVFTPTPEVGVTGEPIKASGERFEYRDGVFQDMPWLARVPPGNFIVPAELGVFEDARWVAHQIRRPLSDVKNDPRLNGTSDLPDMSRGSPIPKPLELGINKNPQEMIDLIEVRDKKRDKVIVFASDYPHRQMYFGDDEFLINGAFPFFPIQFNEDDQYFWATPDSAILEPQQLELNEIRRQNMLHRRLAVVKLLHKAGSMTPEAIANMTSEDVMAAVEIAGEMSDVQLVKAASIPPDLIMAEEQIMRDVRELLGFSRNQMGEFGAGKAGTSNRTTATEASIVKMAAEIRVDERRDMVADVLVNIVEAMHTIIFGHWSGEQVIDVVGPGGLPLWIKFTGPMLKGGKYTTKVDPDTSLPETRAIRTEKAVQVYTLLKESPLIDPMKLTQYLLTELHGTQFDDLIRMLPPLPGGGPNEPIEPGQFGNLLEQQFGEVARHPERLRPPPGAGQPVGNGGGGAAV